LSRFWRPHHPQKLSHETMFNDHYQIIETLAAMLEAG
jgi:hypothetical protein